MAAEVSQVNVADNEVAPTLLNPLGRKVKQVSADGAYDIKTCHKLFLCKSCKTIIPPRSCAGFWEDWYPRNEAVRALKNSEFAQ